MDGISARLDEKIPNAREAKGPIPTLQPQLPTPYTTASTKKMDELSVEMEGMEAEEVKQEIENEEGGATISKAELGKANNLIRMEYEDTEVWAQYKEELGRRMKEREQELEEKRLKSEAELTRRAEGLQAQLASVVKYPQRERMTDPDGYTLALDEEADYWKGKYLSLDDKFAELCARNEEMNRESMEKERATFGEFGKAMRKQRKEMEKEKEMPTGSPYEDQSGYKKEVEDMVPVAPPVTTKKAAKRQAKKAAAPAKTPTTSGATAIVVHGIPCQRPMADIIRDAKVTGMQGILGARWLLARARREGKNTSSVVIYTSFEFVRLGARIKFRGKWLPVELYDPDRRRE
ncbi:hypothetical protein BGX38DRAFT_1143634 [Terfezia claveryi]|nr:hypothetical protein BGX38DRAFT_1143634 [Terfezia claveryi]